MNKKVIFSFILFLTFILGITFKDKLIWIDNFCYSLIYFKSDILEYIMKFITFFCSPLWCVLLTILLFILVKDKKIPKYFLINVILAFLLNFILKLIFCRQRPIDINLIKEVGYSFPSGHAMLSLAIYGYFIYLCLLNKKYLYSILLGLLILLIGISRIYLGVHYASDVIAGFIISFSYLLLYLNYIDRFFKDV